MESNQRALIVEDRADWQAILANTLQSMDWHTDLASNYQEALDLLANQDYDLIVIDPVLDNNNKYNRDGLRLLHEVRDRFPDMRLVVISGSLSKNSINNELPPHTLFMEKQEWDRETFKGMVLRSRLTASDTIGRRTMVNMLRQAIQYKPNSEEMPDPPIDPQGRGTTRVLVVEDRLDWQVILARTLEEENWFWRVVPDADDALHLLQELSFHVVLLDLRLGDAEEPIQEGSGWRLLDFLANNPRRVRVIIVSGEATRGDVATLFTRYPIEGFIDKDTFKKNELLEMIYSATATPKISVQTLGGFSVRRDGETIDDFGSAEAELLLEILVTHRGNAVPMADLQTWLGSDVEAAINSARHLLEPDLQDAADSAFIVQTEEGILLDTMQAIILDFEELERLLNQGKALQAEGNIAAATQIYEQARALYQGEYIPDTRLASWSVPLRNHVQTQVARVLNRLADLYAASGNFDKAIATTQASMQIDSYHESTHRRLMRYHSCNGSAEAALTVYSTLEKLMREFFGETPSEETRTLRDAIAAGQPVPCTEQLDR